MIAEGLNPEFWTTALIVLAVAGGTLRLVLWRRSVPVAARGPVWRFAALIALQGLAGVLLHLMLFPPKVATPPGRLVVATRGAKLATAREPSDILIALPEAGPIAGAIKTPDLGVALRRYPEAGKVRIEGEGLIPRDQIPLDRIAEFVPGPPPQGLASLTLPRQVAPGARFSVGGQVGTLSSGVVELLDPATAVVDRAAVTANGRFQLSASARAPGPALFALRLRDSAGRVVEQVGVPVDTRAQRQPRVLVLAGAPSPETKYLKRWAQDAGIDLRVQIEVGDGVQFGDPPVPLTRATLADIDLVVIDDRRWEGLAPGTHAALDAATRTGLGVLLRPTGPLSASTRRDWARLGVALGDDVRSLRDTAGAAVAQAAPNTVSMVQDVDGTALANWRSLGRGRVGLWTVADSYVLMLAGEADRYDHLWSQLFSVLARPGDGNGSRIEGFARRGARVSLCNIDGPIRLVRPDGVVRSAHIDPATGDKACAAFWPEQAGWHLARGSDGRETAFYVHPADAAPSLAQAANREATIALTETAPANALRAGRRAPGSPWPWAAALLVVLGLLWVLERRPQWRLPGVTPRPRQPS
ncbi:hypothetical protein [Caulobacter sp. DWR1-3-2b1]|uniref:hypothetical protein n=1 Tax=Caulobacter sp. DWR1-3-2b1 TaxID=2804670 RepID=UPI003CF2E6EA